MRYAAGRLLYNGRKNVLWGAGEKGVDILFCLAAIGISIEMFCDSDIKKQNTHFYNKPVVSPESILRESDKYNIVVAVEKEKYIHEIISQLRKYGIENYITWEDIGSIKCPISIHRTQIDSIMRDACGKDVILYGDAKKHETQVLKELFHSLGIGILYLVDDVETEYKWMGTTVKSVYDLLYDRKKHKIIVISDQNDKNERIKKLDEMGMVLHRDYFIYDLYAVECSREYILDVHLGYNFYNRETDKDMPGFQKLGREGAYKIVLLGNSTTDGTLYPFRSWGDFLYEKFSENGCTVQIINGGAGGYSSSQELVKLIRDVIPMRPDIVIDYTGVNEVVRGVVDYPFTCLYHKELFEVISQSVYFKENIGSGLHMRNAEYTMGVRNNQPTWRQFMDNIRTMHGVCREFGILFYAFLQPHLTLKRKNFSVYEMELEKKSPLINQEYIEAMDVFYEHVKEEGEGYIEDITDLFDGVGDVYIDRCHVTEKGNEIIGQFMYDFIQEKVIINMQDLYERREECIF